MLILSRKIGQRIVIAGDIEITVVDVRGEQVRIGITAPRSIAVHRKELLEQVTAENIQAAASALDGGENLGKALPTKKDE
jgi:carbon storage regulator